MEFERNMIVAAAGRMLGWSGGGDFFLRRLGRKGSTEAKYSLSKVLDWEVQSRDRQMAKIQNPSKRDSRHEIAPCNRTNIEHRRTIS